MARIISFFQRAWLKVIIAPFVLLSLPLKSFSKFLLLGKAWLFWARFLFQLSVPTVGKPRVVTVSASPRAYARISRQRLLAASWLLGEALAMRTRATSESGEGVDNEACEIMPEACMR